MFVEIILENTWQLQLDIHEVGLIVILTPKQTSVNWNIWPKITSVFKPDILYTIYKYTHTHTHTHIYIPVSPSVQSSEDRVYCI